MSDRSITILLIEDNPNDAHLIQEYFQEMKGGLFTVHWVKSLAKGFDALNSEEDDVVLLDLNLPDSCGIATVQAIIDAVPIIPVIVLTGQDDELIGIQAMQEGAEDYLVKNDLNSHLLTSSVRYAIERFHINQELKEKNKELELNNKNFHNIIKVQSDGILIVNQAGMVKYANPAAQDILGILFDTLGDIPFPFKVNADEVVEKIINVKQKPCFIELRAADLIWEDLPARLISIRDVTCQKNAGLRLKESEQRYRFLFDGAIDPIYINTLLPNGLPGKIIEVNDVMCQRFGYTREELLTKLPTDLRDPRMKDDVNDIRQILMANKQALFESLYLTKNGTDVPVEINARVLDLGGQIVLYSIVRDITERKRSQELLQQSEEKYRALVDQLNDIIYTTDKEGLFTFVSPAIEKITGKAPYSFLNQSIFKFIIEEDRPTAQNNFPKILSGDSFIAEYRVVITPGDLRWARINAKPLMKGENLIGTQGIITDVTAQKKVEQEIRQSEAQLSNALMVAHLGPWEYNVENDVFTFNDLFYRLFRTTAEREGGYTMSSARYAQRFVHPDEIFLVGKEIQKAIETTEPHFSQQLEHRILYADGEIGHVIVRYSVVKDNWGRTIKTIGVNQDITERKKAEEAIRESEQKFRSFIEESAEGIVLTDESGKITLWNQSVATMFKVPAINVLGKNVWDVHFDQMLKLPKNTSYYETHKKNIQQILSTGRCDLQDRVLEMEIPLPSGESTIIELIEFSIKSERGFLLGSIYRDVTEHKRSEERINRRLVYERMLAEIAAQALVLPKIDDFLEKSLEILGKSLEITRTGLYLYNTEKKHPNLMNDWIDPAYHSPSYHIQKIALKGVQWISEQMADNQVKLYIEPDDDFLDVPLSGQIAPKGKTMLVVPLFIDDKYYGFLGFEDARHERVWKGEDIDILRTTTTIIAQTISRNKYKVELEERVVNRTKQIQNTVEQLEQVIQERQKVQEELLEAKIAAETANRAKSEFLANMSHELRTPLNAITGFSQVMQDGIIGTVTAEQKDVLGNIIESGNHLLNLINEILDLSKIEAGKVELKLGPIKLKPFLERCKSLFSEKAAVKNLSLGLEVGTDLDIIIADEVKIKQVVFNLLSNAVKYTPIGGEVGIIAKKEGNQVQITVWDKGIGIAPENLPKLFQPFGRIETENSKAFGGTGLGLHYSKKLVELHGGAMWLESAEGKGSRFHFTIPLIEIEKIQET